MNILHLLDNTSVVGFYVLGLVAIFASLRVIMLANPVHAILSMIVSLLAIAGIFFALGAPFAGALQIIVYAGAILVLFVFVIMMLNLGITNDKQESEWLAGEVWAVPAGLTVIIAIVLFALIGTGANIDDAHSLAMAGQQVDPSILNPVIGTQSISPKAVGMALFSEYLLLVEVAALLLLAALVAAYHLGKKALDDENISHNSREPVAIPQNSTNGKASFIDNSENLDAPYEYHPVDAAAFQNTNCHNTNHQSTNPQSSNLQHKESL